MPGGRVRRWGMPEIRSASRRDFPRRHHRRVGRAGDDIHRRPLAPTHDGFCFGQPILRCYATIFSSSHRTLGSSSWTPALATIRGRVSMRLDLVGHVDGLLFLPERLDPSVRWDDGVLGLQDGVRLPCGRRVGRAGGDTHRRCCRPRRTMGVASRNPSREGRFEAKARSRPRSTATATATRRVARASEAHPGPGHEGTWEIPQRFAQTTTARLAPRRRWRTHVARGLTRPAPSTGR